MKFAGYVLQDQSLLKKFSAYIFFLGSLLLSPVSVQSQDLGNLDLSELDNYIEKARKEWQVPGLSIAIVKNDSIRFSRGYGVIKAGHNEPVDENTIFAIASNTKAFTATALAILVDEGKIHWDDRVCTYLPDFSLYDPYISNEIRIRDLLCHRSGLKTFSGDLLWYETNYSRGDVLQRTRYLKPSYGFRYRYGYSNIMYLAAGQAIPKAAGMSWDDFVRHRILEPLGMEHTYITLEEMADETNVAQPHHVDLMAGKTIVLPYMRWDNIAPAGALNSSASDMANWIRFQLQMGEWNGSQIVSRENLWETRMMHTVRTVDMQSQNVWTSKHFEGYGLGWQLYDYHGCKVMGHGGGSDGMISRVTIIPEENLGFVILTNSINALPVSLTFYILDKYFTGKSYDWSGLYLQNSLQNIKMEKEKWLEYKLSADPDVGPSLSLQEYCGVYGGELYGNVEVLLHQGDLVLDFLPSPKMIGDLSILEGDTFLIRLRDNPSLPEGIVRFLLDESGNVGELMVDIPNPDFDFTELELKRKED
jgi:CubicO group peptidase (beta-lactamase class C family)